MCFPSARHAWRADKGTMQKIAAQWRLSHLSAADFGASNSVEHASTRAELGYDSPGRVTNSLGNSSRRFHESIFDTAAVFASASDSLLTWAAPTASSAASTARPERTSALL